MSENWLGRLFSTDFWAACGYHSKSLKNHFCIACGEPVCSSCTSNHGGHKLIQIRKYVYKDVVTTAEMAKLQYDCNGIQQFVSNSEKVVHIRPRPTVEHPKPGSVTCRGPGCNKAISEAKSTYCCIQCKFEASSKQGSVEAGAAAGKGHEEVKPKHRRKGLSVRAPFF